MGPRLGIDGIGCKSDAGLEYSLQGEGTFGRELQKDGRGSRVWSFSFVFGAEFCSTAWGDLIMGLAEWILLSGYYHYSLVRIDWFWLL